jgi:hypothetical protein
MLGWLAAYKYVTPTPQVGMVLFEFVWEINQKIIPTPSVILSSLDESKDSATTKSANPATNRWVVHLCFSLSESRPADYFTLD